MGRREEFECWNGKLNCWMGEDIWVQVSWLKGVVEGEEVKK